MVKTKEELLSSLRTVFGDNTDDNTLSIIEDVSDTMDSFNGDGTDWKAEADRIDKEWRQKYHDRFFNSVPDDVDPLDAGNPDPKPLTFEALFTTKE